MNTVPGAAAASAASRASLPACRRWYSGIVRAPAYTLDAIASTTNGASRRGVVSTASATPMKPASSSAHECR